MNHIVKTYCSKINLAAQDNVRKNFTSCEEEIRDFVDNSEYCPNFIKEEFKESRKVSNESNQEEDPFIAGDAFYVEPEGQPKRAAKDEYMHLNDLGYEKNLELDEVQNEFEDPEPNHCDDLGRKKDYKNHDWFEDRNSLKITEKKFSEVRDWIKEM